jgi:hypothetical protein
MRRKIGDPLPNVGTSRGAPLFSGSDLVKRAAKITIGAVVMALSITSLAAGTTESVELSFGAMQTGQPPTGFEFGRTGQGAVGQWIVVDDRTADGNRALVQTSQDRTDFRFPLAIYGGLSAKNVEVTIRFKPLSGSVDQAGGIAIRVSSPENYYVVRADALEDNVAFYRVVKGRRQEIAGARAKIAANEWHLLGLKADDNHFAISFDGKHLYTAKDATIGGPGRVGLWTKADSVTSFDRISIRALP